VGKIWVGLDALPPLTPSKTFMNPMWNHRRVQLLTGSLAAVACLTTWIYLAFFKKL